MLSSMASAPLSLLPTLALPLSSTKSPHHFNPSFSFSVSVLLTSFSTSRRRGRGRNHEILATGGDFLGDFGARDPFPAEIESKFGEKVLGNGDTEHRILIPNISALSLSQGTCESISPSQPSMSSEDAKKLLRKVVGWRLVEDDGAMKLQCMWRVRDYGSGVELINRIYKATEAAGHYPDLHMEQPNQVRAELWTASIGGLSMNDFIVAAKIDEVKALDLLPRKRIWA